MKCWDWEFVESAVTSKLFSIRDCGPLFGPVTDFLIYRNEKLQLILETTSSKDSVSNNAERPAGAVYVANGEVRFVSKLGDYATAAGVSPIGFTVSDLIGEGVKRQESLLSSVEWHCTYSEEYSQKELTGASYLIEWVSNMPDHFVWPHLDKTTEQGERCRQLIGENFQIDFSQSLNKYSGSRSCAHIVVDGIDVFFGRSNAKPNHIKQPGFILYKGCPSEEMREKIRDCISFSLGSFLIYIGFTAFNSEWLPISFYAKSGHALVEDAHRLMYWQPSPLGLRWEHEITPDLLGRMVSSLYSVYDKYELAGIFWKYWHALAAPAHMAAAHFGSAIEGLQNIYIKKNKEIIGKGVVEDRGGWESLCGEIVKLITESSLKDKEKTILVNKIIHNTNIAPQSIVMERFLQCLGLNVGNLENDAWKGRNRAAHGSGGGDGIALVRNNKVLLVMINRMILALSKGSDSYYDFYSLGRPVISLHKSIQEV